MQDLACGYMSGKLLQKLEAVHFMLQHHTSDHFGFLEDHTRNRTIFYNTLSRLLFMDDTRSNFKSFVAPLQQVISSGLRCQQHQVQLADCPAAAGRHRHSFLPVLFKHTRYGDRLCLPATGHNEYCSTQNIRDTCSVMCLACAVSSAAAWCQCLLGVLSPEFCLGYLVRGLPLV